MKQLHIKCHNGKEIVLVDTIGREQYYKSMSNLLFNGTYFFPVGFLKDITEAETDFQYIYKSKKEEIESLIRSHGWHIWENPYKNPLMNAADPKLIEEAEDKTLYNPFIFEKI